MKRWLIVVSIVILATVPRASSRALLPRLRAARHAAPIRQHGTLNRVARELHDAKTNIAEATDAKCQLGDCAKFDELKKVCIRDNSVITVVFAPAACL